MEDAVLASTRPKIFAVQHSERLRWRQPIADSVNVTATGNPYWTVRASPARFPQLPRIARTMQGGLLVWRIRRGVAQGCTFSITTPWPGTVAE